MSVSPDHPYTSEMTAIRHAEATWRENADSVLSLARAIVFDKVGADDDDAEWLDVLDLGTPEGTP